MLVQMIWGHICCKNYYCLDYTLGTFPNLQSGLQHTIENWTDMYTDTTFILFTGHTCKNTILPAAPEVYTSNGKAWQLQAHSAVYMYPPPPHTHKHTIIRISNASVRASYFPENDPEQKRIELSFDILLVFQSLIS